MTEPTRIIVGGSNRPGTPPPIHRSHGLYLDGDKPVPRNVALSYDDVNAALVLHAEPDVIWPYDQIRRVPDQAVGDQLILKLRDDPTARLILTRPDDHLLVPTRAKSLDVRNTHVRGMRIAAWGVAALAAVALIIVVLVPAMADRLATFLPPEGEKALGDATFEQIRTALDDTGFVGLGICDNADGLAALGVMEDRLTAQMDLVSPLTVHVLDHPMVNAFALPGGYVVFFDGLLQEAERPEEIAAVFAHEIGHVQARDPTRIALRSAGSIGVLGLLLGDFAGGFLVLFLAEQIIQADYSQEAEADADAFAHDALLAANLPPDAIATFFERLDHSHGGGEVPALVEHFNTHPALGDRIAAARAATPEGFEFEPVLSDAEWRALQQICL